MPPPPLIRHPHLQQALLSLVMLLLLGGSLAAATRWTGATLAARQPETVRAEALTLPLAVEWQPVEGGEALTYYHTLRPQRQLAVRVLHVDPTPIDPPETDTAQSETPLADPRAVLSQVVKELGEQGIKLRLTGAMQQRPLVAFELDGRRTDPQAPDTAEMRLYRYLLLSADLRTYYLIQVSDRVQTRSNLPAVSSSLAVLMRQLRDRIQIELPPQPPHPHQPEEDA